MFCLKILLNIYVISGIVHSIYDPNDKMEKNPYGMKTINWQGNYKRPNIQVHHNYSKVNVQKPDNPSDQDLMSSASNLNENLYSQRPVEDLEQQTENIANAYPPSQIKTPKSNRPTQSERLENTPSERTGKLYKPNNSQRIRKKIEIYSKCPKNATGQFVFELSCNQFLNCWNGRGFVQSCAPGTLFNPKTLECDFMEKVHCITGPRHTMLGRSAALTAENQARCPEGFSGIIPYYSDCSKFINCDKGVENVMDCAPGTLFDSTSNTCDYPEKAVCVNNQGRSEHLESSSHGNNYRDSRLHGGYTMGYGYNGDRSTPSYNQGIKNSYGSGQQGYTRGHGIPNYGSVTNIRGSTSGSQGSISGKWQPVNYGHQNPEESNYYDSHRYGHNQALGYNNGNSDYDSTRRQNYGQHNEFEGQQGTAYGSNSNDGHSTSGTRCNGQECRQGQLNRPDLYATDGNQQILVGTGLSSNINSGSHRQTQNLRGTTYGSNRQLPCNGLNQNCATSQTLHADGDRNIGTGYLSSVSGYNSNNRGQAQNYGQTTYGSSSGASGRGCKTSRGQMQDCNSGQPYGQELYATDGSRQVLAGNSYSSNSNYNSHGQAQNFGATSYGSNTADRRITSGNKCVNARGQSQDCGEGDRQIPGGTSYSNNRGQNQYHAQDTGCSQRNGQNCNPQGVPHGSDLYNAQGNRRVFMGTGLTSNTNAGGTRQNHGTGYQDINYDSGIYTNSQNYDNQNQHHGTESNGFYGSSDQNYDQQSSGSIHQNSYSRGPPSHSGRTFIYVPSKHSNSQPQCPSGETGLHPHPTDCSKFLNCANGVAHVQECGPGTVFNPLLKVCDYPYNVKCTSKGTQEQNENDYDSSASNIQSFATARPPTQQITPQPSKYDGQNYYTTYGSNYVGHNVESGNTKRRASKWSPVYYGTSDTPDYVYEYYDDVILDPSDEISVDSSRKNSGCNPDQYTCPHGQCLMNVAICNGIRNCNDGADELNCTLSKFTAVRGHKLIVQERAKVLNVSTIACGKFCLDTPNCKAFNYRKLDGMCYLLDQNIGLTGALITYDIFDYYELQYYSINCTNMFHCSNNKCISYSQLCDGIDDCGDRMDEKHCAADALGYGIKLTGGKAPNEGRIEITAFGKTGYICDDMFELRDADVVCHELGYQQGALEVKGNSHFAKNITDDATFYLMDDVTCVGNETTLRDCDFNGWGVHNCMPQEIVGVICKTMEEKCQDNYFKCDTTEQCIPLGFLCDQVFDCKDDSDEGSQNCEAPIELRLSNGSTAKEGRLEVRYHGVWGTVCDDDFNEDAAKVVCGQLGYGGSALVKKDGFFGPGRGPIWLDQVDCQGNETTLQDCLHWDWGEHNCEHSEDVGIVCGDYDISGSERASKTLQPQAQPLPLSNGFSSSKSCGYRKDSSMFLQDDYIQARVIRGSKATRGDYPWQASIRIKGKSKPSHWCGAVVISEKFVLTAAHCLVGFPKGAYIVVAGDYNVDEHEGTEQTAFVEEFYPHEKFREGQKMNNDIALMKLKGNGLVLNEDVQAICLPDGAEDYEQALNCTISGFGSVQSGKAAYSHDLRAGWIPLQPRVICTMPHVYGSSITDGMICAGSLDEGVDACDGDSGGPLACLKDGLFTLYGLTSWGQHCGYANKPGVYVKVAHYKKWIEEKMEKHK